MYLDHVNVYVENLEDMSQFYQDILSLTPGYRPSFSGPPGAWLYDGTGRPVLHLSTTATGSSRTHQHLDHIAFRTDNIDKIIEKLDWRKIEYDLYEVSEIDLVQIFFHDPEGGRLEVSATRVSP
tara:strand:+ start:625 stop:996 length:372 start_codon:yes stop_codon:yes gene_type:complete